MTNQLSTFASSPTLSMSTREIAELTGKIHKNVIRDLLEVCEALEIDRLSFERIYLDSMNREQTEYRLPKDLTTTLVSGYSIPMRHAIVKRWFELEATTTAAIPSDFAAALRLAATQHEALEAAAVQAALAAPKVKVYDTVVADKELTLSTFVRMFHGVNTMAVQKDLTRLGYLFKQGALTKVYSKYRGTLFAEQVIPETGLRKITVLAKGKELLAQLHSEGQLTMKAGFQ